VARINELSPEYIRNELIDVNLLQTQNPFIESSLEVFWNGQKLAPLEDYVIIGPKTIKLISENIIKRDVILCNYIVKK
jgi:hypothetical protein